MVSFKIVRKLAGKTAWVAHVIPGTRWTAQRLFAALSGAQDDGPQEASARGGSRFALIHRCRIQTALLWILEFWTGESVISRCFGQPRSLSPIEFAFDASPWGLGGIVVHRDSQKVLQFFAEPLGDLDTARFGIQIGSCTAQALMESLAILCGLKLWAPLLKASSGVCRVASDSIAALSAARKMASSTPMLNGVGAEIALLVERNEISDLKFEHIPGVLNDLADWCSRRAQPGSSQDRPHPLSGAKERQAPARDDKLFKVWHVAVLNRKIECSLLLSLLFWFGSRLPLGPCSSTFRAKHTRT